MTLIPSPLHQVHLAHGAKLVGFAGWEMPLQFEGIIAEHRAVRSHAGLFDVSHLGKITVEGSGALEALDRILPGRVAGLPPGSAGYNLVLNENGGIVDDVFVYRGLDKFIIVPNAANTLEVLGILSGRAPEGVVVRDARHRWATIALSGPAARGILASPMPEAVALKFHKFVDGSLFGVPVLVARTGYTGETTFEIFVSWAEAPGLWERLLDAGGPSSLKPAGLGARDLLRLEMGYPLHGQDITAQTDPVEAGLGWVIDWDKEFVGKDTLLQLREEGPGRKLVGLVGMGRRIPRSGSPLTQEGVVVGEVTSGNYSPVLAAGIGLGYVRADLADEWNVLQVDLGAKSIPVRITRPPFLPGRGAPSQAGAAAVHGATS